MHLKTQIERKKKKRTIISDFVIDTTFIKELASQVLDAEENVSHTPSFQETCDTLRSLCDQVASSVIALKDMVPGPLGAAPLNLLPPED
jgi:hypothetical protein